MKAHFMRPGIPDDGLGEILRALDPKVSSVSCAVAYITHSAVVDALLKRAAAGAWTRLLLNGSDFLRPHTPKSGDTTSIQVHKEVLRLLSGANYPLDVRTLGQRSQKYEVMHHKFVVSEGVVVFGSANWTRSALGGVNYEVVVSSTSQSLVASFLNEFDALWLGAHAMRASDGSMRILMCPKCESADGVDFESWGAFCTYCGHKFEVVGDT